MKMTGGRISICSTGERPMPRPNHLTGEAPESAVTAAEVPHLHGLGGRYNGISIVSPADAVRIIEAG